MKSRIAFIACAALLLSLFGAGGLLVHFHNPRPAKEPHRQAAHSDIMRSSKPVESVSFATDRRSFERSIDTPQPFASVALPFEIERIGGVDLYGAHAENHIHISMFSGDLPFDQFEVQSRMDQDANELTRLHLGLVQDAVQKSETEAHLIMFVCGLQICIGEFESQGRPNYIDWIENFSIHLGPDPTALQTSTWRSQDGATHLRFMFIALSRR